MLETLEACDHAGEDEWRLIPGEGELLDEVFLRDITGIVRPIIDAGFFLAIRFWKRCKDFGMPKDWRKMTVAQLGVIEMFDRLLAKSNRGKNAGA